MAKISIPNSLVSVHWLYENLTAENLVILDASMKPVTNIGVAEPTAPTCIPNSLRFDYDTHICDQNTSLPHMMPTPEFFTEEMQKMGVNKDSAIVVYDNVGVYASPRAWWMFRAMGHDNVAVLDGGLPAWVGAGYETSSTLAVSSLRGDFASKPRPSLFVDSQAVTHALSDSAYSVVDARSAGRFKGQEPEPRDPQEKAVANRETWRDLKAGCWYEGEIVPVRQQSTRQQEKAQREGVVLRAKNKKYFCDIAEAKEFGKLLWATGCAAGADRARRLVFICDGAVWIWNLIAHYFPSAIQIVDWYHAADRLKRIAEEAFPNLEERQTWLKQVTEDLWQGKVEVVIEACRPLANRSQWAKQSLTYYHNNLERMRYDQFRASGLLIGSGIIESGCKQIVTQRLKLPGAQWNLDGAILTAKARTAWMSGEWQKLVSSRSLLPLAA